MTVSPPIIVCPTATSGRDAVREIGVGPAAEPDDAEARAGAHRVALADVAQDAARDQPGDLHHGDLAPVRQADGERVALVVIARLVEAGVDEAGRADRRCASPCRRPARG